MPLEARAIAKRTFAALRRFDADLDECTIWSELHRAPLESEAGPVGIAAHAGLEAARAVLGAEARA